MKMDINKTISSYSSQIAYSIDLQYLRERSYGLWDDYTEGGVVESDQNADESCRLYLLGPVSLSDYSDNDLTPRHQKSRALLAILAVAPRGSRSRVWLRDKLWSDRSEDQGSASLRQALLDIRKSLGPELREILIADKYTVTLNLSRLHVDILEQLESLRKGCDTSIIDVDQISEFFLEGIDIRDPEFEDWLVMERQVWERKFSDLINIANTESTHSNFSDSTVNPIERAAQSEVNKTLDGMKKESNDNSGFFGDGEVRSSVVLIRPILIGDEIHCQNVFSLMSDGLTRSLIEADDIRVSQLADIQPMLSSDYGVPQLASSGAPLAIRVRVVVGANTCRIGVELLRSVDCSLVWSGECHINNFVAFCGEINFAHELICRTIDEVTRFFTTFEMGDESFLTGQMYGAVHRMFDLASGDLDKAEETLNAIIRHRPSAQAYAWLAFVKTFRVGQRFSTDSQIIIEEAQYNASKAIELNNSNSLVLSLVAHIHSYLFSEYDVAAALFERAIRINPAQPMGWDLYAMLHAYVGEHGKARAMADWVQHLGQHSPYSYYFDTTKCITSALEGDYKESIKAGRQALCQRPKFNSVLRYLISSNAHLGQMDDAQKLLQQLLNIEPDFSVGALIDTGYPTLDTAGGQNFLAGLIKAGVRRE